jgi:hypothetical protein
MLFRICGGIGITLLGLGMVGVFGIPSIVTGIFLIIGGIGLIAGI